MSHFFHKKFSRIELEERLKEYPLVVRNNQLMEILGIPQGTLNRWQWEGKLPRRLPAVGRLVRYAKTDIIDWWLAHDEPVKKRGRPSNAQRAAQEAAARREARS